ncbi:MAG: hypothetical protein ABSC56_08480 [Solirubrobacteraceae bacterium]|jgi:hypothetical protein
MGEYCVGTGRARSAAAILAVTLLGLVFDVARANAITVVAVGCSEPGGGVVNVTIASNDTSGITLAASGGDYSISSASSGTSVNSDCAGLSTATYPSVVLAQTGGLAQTIVLNDESGGLAGGSTCTQIVSALDTSNNSLQIENDEDGTTADEKVGVTPNDATLDEHACSGSDVTLGGFSSVLLDGDGGDPTLDLSSGPGGASAYFFGDSSSQPGEVIGFAGFTLDFENVSNLVGSNAGDTTFVPGSLAGLVLQGRGLDNTLDLTTATSSSATTSITLNGNSTGSPGRYLLEGIQENDFTGIATIKAPPSPTDFMDDDTSSPVTFIGYGTLSNTLDLSEYTSSSGSPLVASLPTGTVSFDGQSAAFFENVNTIVGAANGFTTFQAASNAGVAFEGNAAGNNTLDLSDVPTSSSAPLTVNAQTGAATYGSQTDVFANISSFRGSSDGYTIFDPGLAGGVTFDGQGTVGDTLDLSSESAGDFSTLKVSMDGSTCHGPQLQSTGSVQLLDCLSGISTIDGATAVPTDFQPDPTLSATPSPAVTFVGKDSAANGAVVDLTGFASPDAGGLTVSGLTLAPAANTSSSPGSVSASVGGNAVIFAKFYGITAVNGPTPLVATLQPGSFLPALTNVALAPQTVAFTSAAPSSPSIGSTYGVSASGGASGNGVTFTIDSSSSSGACSISGSTVRFSAAGTCLIDAHQAGNADYAAGSAQQSVSVPAPAPAPVQTPAPTPQPAASFVAPSATIAAGTLTTLPNDVSVSVSCPAGASACDGSLSIVTVQAFAAKAAKAGKGKGKSKAPVDIGSATFTLAGGQTAGVLVPLNAKALKTLKGHHSVTVTITVVSHDSSGHGETTSTTATLDLPK